MAISFSRPDPSSPAAVGSASFPVNKRGYDQGEVRDFLRMVAAELARLQERERFLEGELRAMQTRGLSAPGRLDEETVTTLLGEEAARVLTTARDASNQIRERAEESATRLVKDAAEEAARLREASQLEASRIHEDALRDAEAEIDLAKQQGRDMVHEAREYREKVLSELSRRREAARAQIEQLLHGRDRLLNAFERARLASEDVIGGLTDAHDEPEFIVDLSPTTGPIPVINPAHPSVQAFDQETAEIVDSAPASSHSSSVIDIPIDEVHENVVIEEVAVEELPVDEALEVEVIAEVSDSASVEHPVHVSHTETDATDDHVIESVQDEAEDDPAPSNVVSLFSRPRKSEAIAPEVSSEKEEVNEAPEVKPVSSAAKVKEVDDIFAKLRASSTTNVASKAKNEIAQKNAVESPKTAKAEKVQKSKTVAKPAVIKANPALFKSRDEILAKHVVSIARKLKRVLADEQNNVLEHLRGKRSSLEMDAILGTVKEHAERYAQAIDDDAMTIAGEGAKSVKTSGGSSKRVTSKSVHDHVASSLAHGLIAAFREDTRIAIGEAEGNREILAALMRDVYRKWKMEQIDAFVDDLGCTVYSKGGFLALEPGTKISWIVDPATKCCSECEDNSLAGVVTRGDEFPTGDKQPPAHPGCRCLVSPIQD